MKKTKNEGKSTNKFPYRACLDVARCVNMHKLHTNPLYPPLNKPKALNRVFSCLHSWICVRSFLTFLRLFRTYEVSRQGISSLSDV